MNLLKLIISISVISLIVGCSGNKLDEKGFAISQPTDSENKKDINGIPQDSLLLKTRPSSVLLTGIPQYRLTTIYKENYNKRTKTNFIGYNAFYKNYSDIGHENGNKWNYNFMPGLEAVYGYNMVNISLFNNETKTQKNLFAEPVLVRTLYYPSFSSDTLNNKAVKRNFYMVSVYDEDTNKDGYINAKDLRRFYYIDINGDTKKPLVPINYSVVSSEYDSANDYMYVFAKLDANNNGRSDKDEEVHIFWVDLNNPENVGRQY